MGRLLFWLLMLAIFIAWVRRRQRTEHNLQNAQSTRAAQNPEHTQHPGQARHSSDMPGMPSSSQISLAQPMCACAHCGVYLPMTQAIQSQGKWFCEMAHVPHADIHH